MKKIAFLIDKKIIYIDHQFTNNKNIYLKITKDNRLLITSPINTTDQQIIKIFANKIKKFINIIKNQKTNALYSLQEKFIFYEGKKLKMEFLTGFSKPSIKIKDDKFYVNSKMGTELENLMIIKNYLKTKMLKYVNHYQSLFEKKMKVPSHKIKVSYKMSNWATNNVNNSLIIYSSRLMHFDINVRHYVVVHELAHYFQKNHSQQFYKIVAEQISNYQKYAQKLFRK